MNPLNIEFITVQNFKVSMPDIGYLTDTKNMNASEKYDILKKWIAFLSNHFKPSTFNKKLYNHLHLHCGYIAHYNQNGFYGNYFGTAAQFHWLAFGTKKSPTEYDGYRLKGQFAGKDAVESKEAFLSIFEEIKLSRRAYTDDSGLGGFFYDWNGMFHCHDDYRDLHEAMQMAYEEYVSLWEKALLEADEKRIRHEIKAQRERMTMSLLDAADQLDQIEADVPKTSIPHKSMSLLEFLLDEAV